MKDRNESYGHREYSQSRNSSPDGRRQDSEYISTYRGEIYSRHLRSQAGTSYFLNLKENRESDIYLNIVESKNNQAVRHQDGASDFRGELRNRPGQGPKAFERHSIMIFEEQRGAFASESLAALKDLSDGKEWQAKVEGPQRSFTWKTQSKRKGLSLAISEERQVYGRIIQEQIWIPQDLANQFCEALIDVLEKWLEAGKTESKTRTNNESVRKVVRKKLVGHHSSEQD